jgi:CheY-like chemotaxis protein
MQGDRERALSSGCEDYLSKPIDEDQLFEKIRRLMPD